jgi:hypothetical protein
MRAKARIFVLENWKVEAGAGSVGMTDVTRYQFGKLLDPTDNLMMVGTHHLPHGFLLGFYTIHPDIHSIEVSSQSTDVGFQSTDVGFQHADVGFQHADVGFQHADVGLYVTELGFKHDHFRVKPLNRRKYQVALIHATAPETVMSLYAIRQLDAIKE